MRVPKAARPVAMLTDSEETAGGLALGALAAFLVSAGGAGVFAFERYQSLQITWLDALAGLLVAIVAHGAVRALTLLAAGGHPRVLWGFGRALPYVRIGTGVRIRRAGAVISMVAPLVLVDLAGLALAYLPVTTGIGLVVVVANTTGSVPDLWRAGRLLRLPGWIRCDLRGPSVVIWTAAEHDREPARVEAHLPQGTSPLVGVLGIWAFCLLVAEAICAGAVRLLAQRYGDVGVEGIPLASTVQFVSGPDVVLNFLPVVVGGAALGTLAAAVWAGARPETRREIGRPGGVGARRR